MGYNSKCHNCNLGWHQTKGLYFWNIFINQCCCALQVEDKSSCIRPQWDTGIGCARDMHPNGRVLHVMHCYQWWDIITMWSCTRSFSWSPDTEYWNQKQVDQDCYQDLWHRHLYSYCAEYAYRLDTHFGIVCMVAWLGGSDIGLADITWSVPDPWSTPMFPQSCAAAHVTKKNCAAVCYCHAVDPQ